MARPSICVLSKVPDLMKELTKVVPSVNFHEVLDPDADSIFRNAEILICDFDLLSKHLYSLPNAKWVQGTWAGIDKLMPQVQKSNPPCFLVTRFTGEHFGKIMSEYVIANIVNHERNLFKVKNNQEKRMWSQEGPIHDYRSLFDLSIGILGLGNISRRIGQTLHGLGAKVLALGRRAAPPRESEYSYISRYYTKDHLASFLKECDYVINVLPRTNETNHILDNDVLANCSGRQTVFMNVGRSNVLSEESLIKALNNNWLSAAILDVFDEEPLPKNHPFWIMQQVFITPHVSAVSRAKHIAEHFQSNLKLYQQNLSLPATVDFTKEY